MALGWSFQRRKVCILLSSPCHPVSGGSSEQQLASTFFLRKPQGRGWGCLRVGPIRGPTKKVPVPGRQLSLLGPPPPALSFPEGATVLSEFSTQQIWPLPPPVAKGEIGAPGLAWHMGGYGSADRRLTRTWRDVGFHTVMFSFWVVSALPAGRGQGIRDQG